MIASEIYERRKSAAENGLMVFFEEAVREVMRIDGGFECGVCGRQCLGRNGFLRNSMANHVYACQMKQFAAKAAEAGAEGESNE